MRSTGWAALGGLVIACGGLVVGASPTGATNASFTATCVTTSGPIPLETTHRDITYSVHAPDSVAPGAPFTVPVSFGYAVPVNATVGGAFLHIRDAGPADAVLTVSGGAPDISGELALAAASWVGTVEIRLDKIQAVALVGGHAIGETCTPDHPLVLARVGIGVPLVSIGDAAVVEGSSGTRALGLAVALSRPAPTTVTVGFDTEDGTATAGSDYVATSGVVTIPPGAVSGVAVVRVRGDAVVEAKENLRVRLRDPVGAALGRAVGTGRIIEDDPEAGPRVSVGDGSVVEGTRGARSARFTVSLSEPSTTTVSVRATTVAGSAAAGADYRIQDLVLVFAPGTMATMVPVVVVPDSLAEANETFSLHLSEVSGAVVGRHNGVGRILDDD